MYQNRNFKVNKMQHLWNDQHEVISDDNCDSNLHKLFLFSSYNFKQTSEPCLPCRDSDEPVCAKSVKTGQNETFKNECLVADANCGHSERRKI